MDDINLPESQIWSYLFYVYSSSVILIASRKSFSLGDIQKSLMLLSNIYLYTHHVSSSMVCILQAIIPTSHTSCLDSRCSFSLRASVLYLNYFYIEFYCNRHHFKKSLSLNTHLLLIILECCFSSSDLSDIHICVCVNRDYSQNNLITRKVREQSKKNENKTE